jgi:hypothetical protein
MNVLVPRSPSPLTLATVVAETDRFITTIPPYPNGFAGRGVVVCGGGLGYFPCAWVCIHQLRRLGCTLPIELWHLGARELDERMSDLVAPLGVTCVDGAQVRDVNGWAPCSGYELKPHAILNSPFREVLLLDADNVAVQDPSSLFQTDEYQATGAVFWPDYLCMPAERSAWRVFHVPYREEPEFESGQLLVEKQRCWRALNLALWFNHHASFFYEHVHGDKDTFRFAWHRLAQPFAMPPFPIHTLRGTMCQHDFAGRRLFQHRNTDKWNFLRENERVEGFLYEEECLRDLRRLRTVWDGVIRQSTAPAAPRRRPRRSAASP